MSKTVRAEINCPDCNYPFEVKLYRSLWVEYPENYQKVMQDKVNLVVCPKCKTEGMLETPFIATNVNKKYAIWFDPPEYRAHVDKEVEEYKRIFGANSFYARARRIESWPEFKKMLEHVDKAQEAVIKDIKGRTSTMRPQTPEEAEMLRFMREYIQYTEKKHNRKIGNLIIRAVAAFVRLFKPQNQQSILSNVSYTSWKLLTAIAFFLFLAAVEMPYNYEPYYELPRGYYSFVRIIVSAYAGYVCYQAMQNKYHGFSLALWAVVVVLFNPVVPIKFDKEFWAFLDIITGSFFAYWAYRQYRIGKSP